MQALTKEQARVVEQYLFSYQSMRASVCRWAAAEGSQEPPPEILQQMQWLRILSAVRQRFQRSGGQPLFGKWFDGPPQTVEEACSAIPLGKSMFLHWRERIVDAAALYATQYGLLKLLSLPDWPEGGAS